jgi:DNA-binding XRE family transcriptional regulator
LKLTQTEAARLLNVSKNTWIRWEQGPSHEAQWKPMPRRSACAYP